MITTWARGRFLSEVRLMCSVYVSNKIIITYFLLELTSMAEPKSLESIRFIHVFVILYFSTLAG